MQVKLSLIILSLLLCAYKPKRLVYIQSNNQYEGLNYNEGTGEVNLYIDSKVVANCALQKQIKMYLAYQYVKNKSVVEKAFVKKYGVKLNRFASLHRKSISSVIYYLEHSEHGNLPVIYHMEAYDLLEIKELKPDITQVKSKLEKGGMSQIDIVDDGTKAISLDSPAKKN